jgi:hypothetical protein
VTQAQRNSTPLPWSPKGVSDTLDSTETFPGSMAALQNLIPDPTTPNLWQCRPAASRLTNFTGFTAPGFISALKVFGNFAYGMIASGLFAGFDQPFMYNLLSGAFVTISGIAAGTLPSNAATSGPWTPPIMDLVGSKMIVTHIGFGATTNFIGWIDVSNPASPAWHAGNLSGTITLNTVPTYVAQFNGRAYYIVNTVSQPAVVFSDILNGTNCTAATQTLTFGDTVPLTCLGQLRLYNQLGGIIQGLIVFKGVQNCYQVTGDAAGNNLALNALNVATGTLSPLGVASTKEGLAFISPDGLRIIDFTGTVSDPLGKYGQGVSIPFTYSSQPTRMCMACSGDVIRIATQNGAALNTPQQEWWYHITPKCWSGPHTFVSSLIQAWNQTFVMSPVGVTASLWQSDIQQSSGSTFVENGVQMMFTWLTSMLPNTHSMTPNAVSMSLIDLQLIPAQPLAVAAIDPNNVVIDSVQISIAGSVTTWGAFQWGAAVWGAPSTSLLPRIIPWHFPLVFAKMQLQLNGSSGMAVRIGLLLLRYKQLRYLTDYTAVA